MAKKKAPVKKKPAARKQPARKAAAKKPPSPPVVDASPRLRDLGFFRADYLWEADRHILAFDARVRVNVDHHAGVVAPVQVRALELLLECDNPLRPVALQAAYKSMLNWVAWYRDRHPEFRGKPIGERAFTRGCELRAVDIPAPAAGDARPAPRFVLTLFWPDDTRPCEVRFEWKKGVWAVTECERT